MRIALIAVIASILGCTIAIPETLLKCDDCEEVKVDLAIDGDTLDTPSGRIRPFGIDTAEAGERCAVEATDRMRDLAGGFVRLENGPRLADRFGRRLAYVYTTEGFSIDEILVQEGLATAWTEDGQHRDFLMGLERGTRMMNDGCLWPR